MIPFSGVAELVRNRGGFGRAAIILHGFGINELAGFILPGHCVAVGVVGEGCSIGSAAGHFRNGRRPAREGVGVLGVRSLYGRNAGVDGRLTVSHLAGLQHGAVLVHELNRVLVDGACVRGLVGRAASHLRNGRRPTCEGVGVLGIRRLYGRFAGVDGRLAVSNLAGLQHCAVLVHELNRVLVDGACVRSLVGHVAGHFRNSGRPASEGVGVLCGSGLGGLGGFKRRHGAVGYTFVLFQNGGAVFINPGHRVGVGAIGEDCRVGCFSSNSGDLGRPACEGVGVLCGSGLGGRLAGVDGSFTVSHLTGLQHGAVLVHELDRIRVDGPLCCDCHVVGRHGGRNRDIPACKGVPKLGGRSRCGD